MRPAVFRLGTVIPLLALLGSIGALTACGDEAGQQAAGTVTVTVQGSEGSTAATSGAAVAEDMPVPDASSSEASVVVEKSGFGQVDESASYGVVLRNRGDEAARDVQLTVNLVGRDGVINGTETESINVIPAKARYFAGGDAYLQGTSGRVATVETSVEVAESLDEEVGLPKISNVRFSRAEYSSGIEVVGQVENPFTQPLSDFAKIGIVAFDGQGNVVGGGFTFLTAPLAPGRSAAFSTSLYNVDASLVSRVEASMDNSVR